MIIWKRKFVTVGEVWFDEPHDADITCGPDRYLSLVRTNAMHV